MSDTDTALNIISCDFNSFFSEKFTEQISLNGLFNHFRKGLKKAHVFGISYSFGQSVIFFAYAAAFSYGADLVDAGELDFVAVFRYLLSLGLSSFSDISHEYWSAVH